MGRAAVVGAAGLAVALAGCGGQSGSSPSDNLVAGKQLFVQRCGACHTLARAATKGTVGPNLDAAFRRSLSEGFERSVVRGVVAQQIQIPSRKGKMPADLVKGAQVNDVAGYVALSVAKPGQDTGLLATAVKQAGQGKPAVEKGGTLEIDADPGGQLTFVTKQARAKAGPITIKMRNQSNVMHDIAIEGNGVKAKGAVVGKGGTSQLKVANLPAGTYAFFCTVPGHRAAGMEGRLVVK